MIEELRDEAAKVAEKLESSEGPIRVVGQYDADGISATAIACRMLDRLGREYEREILKQLYREDVERLADAGEENILFVDIGSGKSEAIQELLVDGEAKNVYVSDHHDPQVQGSFPHLNPHFVGIDGGEEISAAGVTYLLATEVSDENKDLAWIALVGATGDVQKQGGEFLGLNGEIAERALELGQLERRKGLDLYGRTTKPLQKSLMYTTDPHLEGVTDSESGAVQLVKSAGIELKNGGSFRTLSDLSEEEEQRLVREMLRNGLPAEELLNDVYMLPNGYEIDEFSTVVNACGRLGEPEKGLEILLEDDLELAEQISDRYGSRISDALSYVERNADDPSIVSDGTVGVIDAGSGIEEEFIGTVTTIAMSNGLLSSPVAVGLAEAERDRLKLSTRASKEAVENGLDLGEIVAEVCELCDGEGGGHSVAAGAKIPASEKSRFLEEFRSRASSGLEA